MTTTSRLQDLTKGAVFVALLIVFAMIPGIPLGFLPVPIVLQNLAVMLVVLILGPKRGTMVMTVFLLLAAVGLPVLSGGRGGLAVLTGPTAGYIWAWLLFPAVYWGLNRLVFGHRNLAQPAWWQSVILLIIVDLILDFGMGAAWLHFNQGLGFWSAYWANMAFVPGDLLKIALAVFLDQALWQASQH
ncbi:biotin transporter BioY [Fructobacillus tropaeoli]|uniref:biotin transporter BioY n=1 Tax=Fructobacillus tropaeoli TaxID=709323 RepID=UPI002D89BD38|nr:Biotin transporter BioY (BioY) [Fructobacillus tropaeoli]CAK1248457.1 Biotin transporter BioY (BioY) [Fructobacillus tropaeoli]